jgi:hypothetical protein
LPDEYIQEAGGTLTVVVSGPGSNTVLAVGGTAQLDGELAVTLDGGYVPDTNDVFTVLSAGTRTNTFATTDLPALPGDRQWEVDYSTTNVVLSVTATGALSGYDQWASAITNGLTDPLESATGDFPNLLKYATGSSATESDNLPLMDGVWSNGQFALQFNRNTNATDVTFSVEGCFDVRGAGWEGFTTNRNGAWDGAAGVAEGGAVSPARVTVWDIYSPTTNRALRLRVTLP